MAASPQWRSIGRLWAVFLVLILFVMLFVIYAPSEPRSAWGVVRCIVISATGFTMFKVYRRLGKITNEYKQQLRRQNGKQ